MHILFFQRDTLLYTKYKLIKIDYKAISDFCAKFAVSFAMHYDEIFSLEYLCVFIFFISTEVYSYYCPVYTETSVIAIRSVLRAHAFTCSYSCFVLLLLCVSGIKIGLTPSVDLLLKFTALHCV